MTIAYFVHQNWRSILSLYGLQSVQIILILCKIRFPRICQAKHQRINWIITISLHKSPVWGFDPFTKGKEKGWGLFCTKPQTYNACFWIWGLFLTFDASWSVRLEISWRCALQHWASIYDRVFITGEAHTVSTHQTEWCVWLTMGYIWGCTTWYSRTCG